MEHELALSRRDRHGPDLEKALEAQERERNFFAESPVFAIEWDPVRYDQWSVQSVSDNVEKILGYGPAEMTQREFRYTDLIHPDDREHIISDLEHNISRRIDSFEQSCRLRTKAGHYLWCRDYAVLHRDDAGNLTAIRSYLYDHTAQKRAEEALRAAQEQLEKTAYNLTENIPVGTYTMVQPADGGMAKFAFMSRRFLELTGLNREEAAEDPLKAFACVHPDDFDAWVEMNARTFAQKIPFWGETRIVINGEVRWITAESKPRALSDGTTVWEGVLADITDRKRAEQALRESLGRFNDLVSHVSVGVYIVWHRADGSDDFEYVSDGWCAMNQIRREDVMADSEVAFNIIHPDDRASFMAANRQAVGDRKRFLWEGRTVVGGKETFVRMESTPVFLENGDSRWFGIQQDVTEGRILRELIIREKERAESASIAKSEFLANMSHEIRTPLNGVIGFTDLLKNTPLAPHQKQYVDNANVSGHALLGIINGILDFSKIEAGKMELDVISTDIVELLENCVDIIRYSAEQKHLEVLLDLDESLPRFAVVDPVRLKQILTNLLSNAVKFTEEGEVELNVRYTPLDRNRGTVTFTVRDTGIGISETQREKLFKPFSQADGSTTRRFGGTGLGLIISQTIADAMGSTIQVNSTPGEGAEFFFDLTTTVSMGDALATGPIESIKRCLIIDDNARNRLILERMLRPWQLECVSTGNGRDALRQLEAATPFDLVICDFAMPDLDGLETIRMIRANPDFDAEKLPVILLHFASEDAQFHQTCDRMGVRLRMSKPVKRGDLAGTLSSLLRADDGGRDQENRREPRREEDQVIAARATILVAEDVAMNMLLTTSILQKMLPKSKIVKASNGLHAVEQYRQEQPDLVLMDVQMPELDGLQATQRIRRIEAETGRRVPILALTAGALKEEKERCIAAGMDDFLTKPIDSKKLLAVLRDYIATPDIDHRAASTLGETAVAEEAPHFNYAALANRCKGDDQTLQQMLSIALHDIPDRIENIAQAYGKRQAPEIARWAHALKGIALTMRMAELAGIAGTIERSARENDLEDLPTLLTDLEAEWGTVKQMLLAVG